jgi:hypothetical protein
LLKELRSKKSKEERELPGLSKKNELFNSKSKDALKKNLNLKYLNRYKNFENPTKTDRKVDYGKNSDKSGKFKNSFKFNQQMGLTSSGNM